MYSLDRQGAANLLHVSLRTIDRYIQKKKFSFKKRHGKIFFSEEELQSYIQQQHVETVSNISYPKPPTYIQSGIESSSVSLSNFDTNRHEKEKELLESKIEMLTGLLSQNQQKLLDAYHQVGSLKQQMKQLLPSSHDAQKTSEELIMLQQKIANNEFILRIYFIIIVLGVGILSFMTIAIVSSYVSL